MGFFDSKTTNTTNTEITDLSSQISSNDRLDARGGQIVEVAGVSGTVNLSLSDQGAIGKAFSFAESALDSVATVAELATDQANTSDDALDSFVIFGGIALIAIGVIVSAGSN